MKSIKIIFFILTIATNAFSQKNSLEAFNDLIDGAWVSEGTQLGGFEGKTEYQFNKILDNKAIHVKTFATDPKTRKFGIRNEGVRIFNATTNNLEFYEFDIKGGVTLGIIILEGKNIHYEYEYHGMKLRDSWIYNDKDHYKYIVGVWESDGWKQKFHETVLVRR